jgi:hypothetical protein
MGITHTWVLGLFGTINYERLTSANWIVLDISFEKVTYLRCH